MPVHYFVGQNAEGRELAPDTSHETLAVIEIIKRVYEAFNHHQYLYALIANLNKQGAMADLVVITERGFGVVELKHYFGTITLRGNQWYAGNMPIHGKPGAGYHNPHEQVQLYTDAIRMQLLFPENTPYLPGKYADWERFEFGTAVCFTHEDADFSRFPSWHYQKNKRNTHIKEWELFTLLKPADIPGWVSALRFGVNKDRKNKFEAFQLTSKQILRIVKDLFNATEWTEIKNLMPTGKPYAYLLLKQEDEEIIPFGLDHEKLTIGRKAACDITIPEPFERVSRLHAKITRTVTGVLLEDCSSNGTFVDGERITKKTYLEEGQQISLGGTADKEHVCVLEFTYHSPEISETEAGTQVRMRKITTN